MKIGRKPFTKKQEEKTEKKGKKIFYKKYERRSQKSEKGNSEIKKETLIPQSYRT